MVNRREREREKERRETHTTTFEVEVDGLFSNKTLPSTSPLHYKPHEVEGLQTDSTVGDGEEEVQRENER